MGLPEALCITSAEVHGGVLQWEVNVSRFPIVECFLNGGPYRGGLMRAIVLPSGRRRERRQQSEDLLRRLRKDYQLLPVLQWFVSSPNLWWQKDETTSRIASHLACSLSLIAFLSRITTSFSRGSSSILARFRSSSSSLTFFSFFPDISSSAIRCS